MQNIEWLTMDEAERRISLQQASARSGISVKAIEKDWWVTLALKAVFNLPFAKHIQFKGGTSLSKCWHLIERFSEDVDLSIDRKFLGFAEDLSKSRVKHLKKAASLFTSTIFRRALDDELLRLGVPGGMLQVIAEPIPKTIPDIDPQVIRINYASLVDPVTYIEDSVKIEVSARSLKEQGTERKIQSLLGEHMPDQSWSDDPFLVTAVEPKRTFLEKIFLLHEEFLRPVGEINYNRMSRHLYDLERMIDTEHSHAALANKEYYDRIVLHRRKFIFKQGVDYDSLRPETLSFLPPSEVMERYKNDYAQMKEQMIYGENVPEFETLILRLKVLLEKIKRLGSSM
ncbi:MAG: nucleotidyl transferase AbiEii/AbiGii toxin family protein [Ferruginibacter sp.]